MFFSRLKKGVSVSLVALTVQCSAFAGNSVLDELGVSETAFKDQCENAFKAFRPLSSFEYQCKDPTFQKIEDQLLRGEYYHSRRVRIFEEEEQDLIEGGEAEAVAAAQRSTQSLVYGVYAMVATAIVWNIVGAVKTIKGASQAVVAVKGAVNLSRGQKIGGYILTAVSSVKGLPEALKTNILEVMKSKVTIGGATAAAVLYTTAQTIKKYDAKLLEKINKATGLDLETLARRDGPTQELMQTVQDRYSLWIGGALYQLNREPLTFADRIRMCQGRKIFQAASLELGNRVDIAQQGILGTEPDTFLKKAWEHLKNGLTFGRRDAKAMGQLIALNNIRILHEKEMLSSITDALTQLQYQCKSNGL